MFFNDLIEIRLACFYLFLLENYMTKSLRIFSIFLTVGPDNGIKKVLISLSKKPFEHFNKMFKNFKLIKNLTSISGTRLIPKLNNFYSDTLDIMILCLSDIILK